MEFSFQVRTPPTKPLNGKNIIYKKNDAMKQNLYDTGHMKLLFYSFLELEVQVFHLTKFLVKDIPPTKIFPIPFFFPSRPFLIEGVL